MTVGAGTRWVEAYDAVTTKHHRYVQGGGCTTVGVAGGFTQGGGYGSFSKKYGTGAAGILQVEVVTADGKVRIANQCQNQDLFWAIRGGGGGTYGVVTKMTLMTHPLPQYFGILKGTISAKDDAAYKQLIKHFLIFFRDKLMNSNWGEQFHFQKDNTISLFLLTQGLNKPAVNQLWQPLQQWVEKSNGKFHITMNYTTIPADKLWSLAYWKKHDPAFVVANTDKNAQPGEFWWAPNSDEVYMFWYTYQSWYFPSSLLSDSTVNLTTNTIFKASRLAKVQFHINKGLGGASYDAIRRELKTSINPRATKAAALVIFATGTNKAYLNIPGHQIDKRQAQHQVDQINKAMHLIKQLAPNAGTYPNEADYFQKNWQTDFWGVNYPRLLKIKQRYDPSGLFYCHHCVGSESWKAGGMCSK